MQGPKWPVLLIIIVYETLCGHWFCLGQVLYLGRAPRTKETLPDFPERCRVNRHPQVFRRLTDSQRTPRIWGVTLITCLVERWRLETHTFHVPRWRDVYHVT